MGLSTPDYEKRKQLMEKLNGAIADVDIAEKRVRDAKSELGTAECELDNKRAAYTRIRHSLEKLLPAVDPEIEFHAIAE